VRDYRTMPTPCHGHGWWKGELPDSTGNLSNEFTIGFQDTILLRHCMGVIIYASILDRDPHVPCVLRVHVCIPCRVRRLRVSDRQQMTRGHGSLSSGKGRSDFALCCAVSSIVLSVRALPPPSPFSPRFSFLFSVASPSRDSTPTALSFIIVRRPRLHPSKKSSQTLPKAALFLFQPHSPNH